MKRSLGLTIAAAALGMGLSACGASTSETDPPPEPSTPVETSAEEPTEKPAEEPAAWKLSLDGFGPVTIGMTADEAIATGGFVRIPYCDVGALDWTGQKTEDDEGIVIANLNENDIVWRINIYQDPSPLDTGVGFTTTYDEFVAVYGDQLIASDTNTADDSGIYAVNGESNHLSFVVRDGVVNWNSGIHLMGGRVAPDTVPNASSCKAAWRS